MSRNSKKKKKSTNKYRNFRTLPLIPIIAIIEVLVLIGVSTYAWFYLSTNKTAEIGTVSVDADSGLDIDFKYSNQEDYINIWNYIDNDFTFEPVTSLDGRNVFIPTSGTFDKTNTTDMIFREGTVNDINSKYINIDFELTNTTDANMEVYLNNNSEFYVVNPDTQSKDESRALRLAFYPNDGSSGNVTSQLIGGTADYSGIEEQQIDPAKIKTVYFDNTKWVNNKAQKNWEKVNIYLWNSTTNTAYSAWPGVEMSRSSGPICSFTFTEDDVVFDKVIFNNGNGTQTGDLTFYNNYVYTYDSTVSTYKATWKSFTANTVYFVKPNNWTTDRDNDGVADVYVHAWRGSDANPSYYTNWDTDGDVSGLDKMKYEGSGIYSYTYDGSSTGAKRMLFTNGNYGENNQTVNFNPSNGTIYFVNGKESSDHNKYKVTTYSKSYKDSTFAYNTVYFYNSLGWTNPHMVGSTNPNDSGLNTIDLPMTSLTGNVFYCMVPEVYTTVYFRDKNDSNKRTANVTNVQDGYVYRSKNQLRTGTTYYDYDEFRYNDYTTPNSGYAVISPGVSAGFQRTYTPVVSIDRSDGQPTQVIPAFSNSIDNYIFGNQAGPLDEHNQPTSQTVFDIPSKCMVSLSMVVWLEGTDPACTSENYPGNQLRIRLEFASRYYDDDLGDYVNKNTGDSATYRYKFYDKTREVWTSDRQSTESGVTVAPVMQLYDNTIGRGYLMNPETYETVNGKTKVSCWAVDAPASVALKGHDIIFRRVNPYDEDEVWNYWHAGKVAGTDAQQPILDREGYTPYTVYDVAKAGTNDTICFTAFADGSPTAEILEDNGNYANQIADADLPAVSCGGLWGNHNVRTLTLVDGLDGHPCKNNDGIMTLSYSYKYTYTSSGTTYGARTVKIEYKASGPDNQIFYYFVVPDALYTSTDPNTNTQGLRCTFKNYYDYDDDYAINSDRNSIKYRGVYGDSQNQYRYSKISVSSAPVGDYFMLDEDKRRNTQGAHHYWGSDIMYIETTNSSSEYGGTSDYVLTGSDKNKWSQVQYFENYDGNHSFYSYLWPVFDSSIIGNAATVFVSVVPCGTGNTWYNHYRVEVSLWTDPSNKIYWTDSYELHGGRDTIAKKSYETGSNLTINRNFMTDNKNIVKLKSITSDVYLKSKNRTIDRSDYGQTPYAHVYNSVSNAAMASWPGIEMGRDAGGDENGYRSFKITVNPVQFNSVIFHNNAGNETIAKGLAYSSVQVFGINEYETNPWSYYDSGDRSIINTEFYESYNPHYVPSDNS